jgi:predicted type IV restriction endonuclease
MNLEEPIDEIRFSIKVGSFANEVPVSQTAVLSLPQGFSWPVYDTQIACLEYSLQSRRIDFTSCHPPGKPIAFIEFVHIPQVDGTHQQLHKNAFHVGIPLTILKDRQKWKFFLSGEWGEYRHCKFSKLGIIERGGTLCRSHLTRYRRYVPPEQLQKNSPMARKLEIA